MLPMIAKHDIHYQTYTKTVQDLFNLYENGHLNLEPGFQRESIWGIPDQRRLIDSIVRGYPLPSIFLYQRIEDGQFVYDVIDGKQRIETLLMFTGLFRGSKFAAKITLPGEDMAEWVNWNDIKKQQLQHLITGYQLQCIEVTGGLSDIIDVFVRINSTGKALTTAEKRNARYFNDPFLVAAKKLSKKFHHYFLDHKVLTLTQMSRMKDVELLCELMLSAHADGVINKKAALDKVMETGSMTPKAIVKAVERTVRSLNLAIKLLPNLKQTRFSQLADFYSLTVLLGQFEREGLILSDKKRNALARDLLTAFGTGVDLLRLKHKKGQGAKPNEELFREYLLTVLEGTDSQDNRQRRGDILRGLLVSLFEKKDKDRGFSPEQRRVLWNTTAVKKCTHPGCHKTLTWEDFTIDHIKPWSKGGKTALENAALMCLKHNAGKGNKYVG